MIAPTASAPSDAKLCRCGHGVDHEHITEEPKYSGIDYLWMLLGVSSRAVPYMRKCAICGFVFELTEPKRPW